ncbi:MAG: cytochrome d ubiquinol oxidase subunit II, partial [Muribaculaceae bacterium]|nr:cytochrome d ubiquinol oxidase subunit II [Muribaculaceae bacterium]
TVTDMTPGGRLTVAETPYKYFINMTHNAWEGIALLTGVVLVVYGIIRSVFAKHWTKGIWYSGIGTFLVVASLFWAAGYDSTPFYPSLTDPSSSLSIRNASSSRFTLECMSYVSILIPFVLGYIAYVWRAMDLRKLSKSELDETSHKY